MNHSYSSYSVAQWVKQVVLIYWKTTIKQNKTNPGLIIHARLGGQEHAVWLVMQPSNYISAHLSHHRGINYRNRDVYCC